jgi:hypothetical protein
VTKFAHVKVVRSTEVCDDGHMRPGVRLYVGGELVPGREFARRLMAVVDLLDELAGYHGHEKVDWGISHATSGSIGNVLTAPGLLDVEEVAIGGIFDIAKGVSELPSGWNATAARLLSRVTPVRGRTLTIGYGDSRRAQCPITTQTKKNAMRLAEMGEPRLFGSVTGHLDKPQRYNGLFVTMIDRATGRHVKVQYDGSMFERVSEAWKAGRVVEMSGRLHRTIDGRTRSLEATMMHVFSPSVSFNEVVGLLENVKDFDPAQFLDSARG